MTLANPAAAQQDCVVLLHGLARTATSFKLMEWRLSNEGYHVVNVDYPSKKATIEDLADIAIPNALKACKDARKIHFVTHSMGGILLRYYMKRTSKHPENLGNTVMLAPPNQGSPIVDQLHELPGFELWNWIAGLQLGTGDDSLPLSLGPVEFPGGVIEGNQSISPIFSTLLESPNDGKVTVSRTKVDGMADHIVLPVTHTFMMNNPKVYQQVMAFLKTGKFEH